MIGRELITHPRGGPPYAGGDWRTFSLADVVRWGRLAEWGRQACLLFVAELEDGKKYVLGPERDRTTAERRYLRALGRVLPGARCAREEGWRFTWETPDQAARRRAFPLNIAVQPLLAMFDRPEGT